MKKSIVLAMDEPYYHKAIANNTFASLAANWPHRVCILCIGFDTPLNDLNVTTPWELKSCELTDLPTYRANWPTNRPHYVCAEAGDFLDYFAFEPDELIIHIDADMVMQRKLTDEEMMELENAANLHTIQSTQSSYPATTFAQEAAKLNPRHPSYVNEMLFFGELPLFCAGFVVARAIQYRVIKEYYHRVFPKYMARFDHHAVGQLILNTFGRHPFHDISTRILPGYWSAASWYKHQGEIEVRGNLLYCEDEVVIFNHNKFKEPKGFLK